jgi:hypothetical protein
MKREELLARIEGRYREFAQSYAGLTAAQMCEPRAAGEWSVKDIIGHVATWEEESLKALPLVAKGLRTPPYGGIDRFNAEQAARKRDMTLDAVLAQAEETHCRLLAYVLSVPESLIESETRFRHRLRMDTYGHYPHHTQAVRAWRERRGY